MKPDKFLLAQLLVSPALPTAAHQISSRSRPLLPPLPLALTTAHPIFRPIFLFTPHLHFSSSSPSLSFPTFPYWQHRQPTLVEANFPPRKSQPPVYSAANNTALIPLLLLSLSLHCSQGMRRCSLISPHESGGASSPPTSLPSFPPGSVPLLVP